MRLESTRRVVPRTALPAPLQRVSASSLQCLVIASGERRCASVRKESMNVVVREAEGRGVICMVVDDAELPKLFVLPPLPNDDEAAEETLMVTSNKTNKK